jgi:hypothetical protein
MCAISGSFSKAKLEELYKLNAYRGERSYSLTSFEYDNENRLRLNVLFQDEGPLDLNVLHAMHDQPGRFFIAHSQAPTTETRNIHPAVYGKALLWHNGIVKQKNISAGVWDTQWLLEQISDYGWSSLSRVDGTFACVMYWSGDLYVFRNEISPLFFDYNFNFSSTKFDGSQPLPPNVVHKLDLNNKCFYKEAEFETFENPYYIPETL